MKRFWKVALVVLILAAFAVPVAHAMGFKELTPDTAAVLLLGIAGVVLQVVFKYVPVASTWYQAQENKGLLMLAFVAIVSVLYFALACTPLAGDIGIGVSCTWPDALLIGKAVWIVAITQSATYLYTRNSPAA